MYVLDTDLLTRNTVDFGRVLGLKFEDWSASGHRFAHAIQLGSKEWLGGCGHVCKQHGSTLSGSVARECCDQSSAAQTVGNGKPTSCPQRFRAVAKMPYFPYGVSGVAPVVSGSIPRPHGALYSPIRKTR